MIYKKQISEDVIFRLTTLHIIDMKIIYKTNNSGKLLAYFTLVQYFIRPH